MFSSDRQQMRRMYTMAWQKYQANLPMEALEKQIAEVVKLHPEYHKYLTDEPTEMDFSPEQGQSNPFLHMGLHLALREQLATHRPQGIVEIVNNLTQRLKDPHEAEHLAMDCLAEMIWQMNRGETPDEASYLQCLRKL